MKVALYETSSGRSPVEDFISDLPKADQARFADVFEGIEKYGLGCPRVQFRQLRGKLWEVKFNTQSGGYRNQKTPTGDLEIAEKRMKEVLGL